jgi:dienelactone hydrolase
MRIFLTVVVMVFAGCASTQTRRELLDWTFIGFPETPELAYECQDVTKRLGLPETRECVDQLKGPRPLIVFMHGCGGLGGDDMTYIAYFRKLGYVTVAMAHLARGVSTSCGTLNAHGYRIEEIDIILDKVKDWKWVDRSKMVLVGYSQGGIATALYSGDAFKGKVIFGWACATLNRNEFDGVRGNVPTLSINGARDEWVPVSRCGEFLDGRPGSRAIVLDGVGHYVMGDPRAQEETRKFLADILR